jgi:tripartite-type tricarboxylate transporter receptor subunit TctC
MLPRRHLSVLAGAAILGRAAQAQQSWSPSRSIRILVGAVPGGGNDTTTRILAPKLQALLGQPIVVENKPGGAGTIAAEATINAPPDGHTLVMGTIASLVMNPIISRLTYDTTSDLTPIGRSVEVLNVVVVPVDRPWRDLRALIAAARARPETLAYGSSGIGSGGHLAGALLDHRAGIRTVHVPYRGGGQLIADIISGKVDYSAGTATTVMSHIEAGRLRALAVPGAQRTAMLPDVPTVAEAADLPGYAIPNWYAVMGPRALPEPIIARLSEALTTALRDPEVVANLMRHGLEPSPSSPAELLRFMREETARWAPILREAGVN